MERKARLPRGCCKSEGMYAKGTCGGSPGASEPEFRGRQGTSGPEGQKGPEVHLPAPARPRLKDPQAGVARPPFTCVQPVQLQER